MSIIIEGSIELKIVNKDDFKFLYNLLAERDSKTNISHKKMPSYKQHIEFIYSKPYAQWYVIFFKKQKAGTIYLSKNNEVGIFLKPNMQKKGIGKIAMKKLIELNPKTRILANINPINYASQKFFKDFGFKLIQYTYELKT